MKTKNRRQTLMPNGIPRWVRCYDNGGKTEDRYTVVFTRKGDSYHPYLAMSANPFHPQGFAQHGQGGRAPIDTEYFSGRPPAMGRRNHLGKRIPFSELPEDCRKLVISDYRELWGLNTTDEKDK